MRIIKGPGTRADAVPRDVSTAQRQRFGAGRRRRGFASRQNNAGDEPNEDRGGRGYRDRAPSILTHSPGPTIARYKSSSPTTTGYGPMRANSDRGGKPMLPATIAWRSNAVCSTQLPVGAMMPLMPVEAA